jgi:hypothetical protein
MGPIINSDKANLVKQLIAEKTQTIVELRIALRSAEEALDILKAIKNDYSPCLECRGDKKVRQYPGQGNDSPYVDCPRCGTSGIEPNS